MKNKDLKFVCLGGGIGTVNLIKGLKSYIENIAVIISAADDGGSSGRLRRLYNIIPPGDLVSCMSALTNGKNKLVSKLLTYRFPGDRYGNDHDLSGHKLGNLIMVALRDITGNFEDAVLLFQKLFLIKGIFLPATKDPVKISAKTIDGQEVYGEETIDLGKYNGQRILDQIFLHPANIQAHPKAVEYVENADVIIAGPGDLYTTILPVLIVPQIKEALLKSKAQKIFIVNVANKPFETKDYKVSNYVNAVKKHLGLFPFDAIIVNRNFSIDIPKEFQYSYVVNNLEGENGVLVVEKDLIDKDFPLYHNSLKLAKAVISAL